MAFININLEFSHFKREKEAYDKLLTAFRTDITNIYLIYY